MLTAEERSSSAKRPASQSPLPKPMKSGSKAAGRFTPNQANARSLY